MRCQISCSRGLAIIAGLTVAVSGAACSGATFADTPAAGEQAPGPWSSNELERTEIEARGRNDVTAMSLISRLRPAWLRARGPNSFSDPTAQFPIVYIDEVRHGGLGTLYQIPASEIYRIQFFSTSDATTRWGTGHPAGVINIVTGREPRL